MQCTQFFRQAHILEKTGKIQVFVLKKRVNSTRDILTTRVHKSTQLSQNYKNTGIRRAILPKCPSRRANPSLNGQLGNTAIHSFFAKGESSCRQTVVSTLQPEGKQYQDTGDLIITSTSLTRCPQVQ